MKKGPDEMEKFRDVLWQSNIEHKSEQFRDERKVITHEVFKVNCDFRVQAKIEGDHETGKIKIVTKNVGGFEVDLFNLMAQEMNEQAVEEFAKYFIGRPNNWAELVEEVGAERSRPRAAAAQAQAAAATTWSHNEPRARAARRRRRRAACWARSSPSSRRTDGPAEARAPPRRPGRHAQGPLRPRRPTRAAAAGRMDGPHFLGEVVNHAVLDPRDGRTLLAAVQGRPPRPHRVSARPTSARPGRRPRRRPRSRRRADGERAMP